MPFISIVIIDGKNKIQSITVNTGYIFKIFRDINNPDYSIIAYDLDLECTDTVAEKYYDLVKRIGEAEEGEINANPSSV